MEKEFKNLKMEIYMKDLILKEFLMVKGNIHGQMEIVMKDNSIKVLEKDMVL
jgi:hypothetical protein